LGIEQLAEVGPFFSPGQTLIRRSALEVVGGFDPSIWGADDFDLYLRLAKLGELRYERRLSLHYRLHAGNASKDRKKMLLNSYKVVRRHFPDERSAIARKAYRWLYLSVGRERVWGVKRAIRTMDIPAMVENVKGLPIFVSAAMRDCVLTKQMLSDLLPACLLLK